MSSVETSDYPALTLEWDQTDGVDTAGASWTDITAYLRSGSITMGRQRLLDAFNPGTATFVLDNRDRRFDPLYSAGPYFGNLLPRRQIRLRATFSAVTYDLWRGYIDGWPQSYPEVGMDSEVTVTCTDGFLILARANLPDSVWAIELQTLLDAYGGVWYRLGEQSGTLMADSSGNAVHGTYEGGATFNHRGTLLPYGTTGGSVEFNGSNMAGVVPNAAIPAGTDYTILFWTRMPDEVADDGVFAHHQTVYLQERAIGSPDDSRCRFVLEPSAGAGSGQAGSLVFECSTAGANPRWSNVRMDDKRVYFVAGSYDIGGPAALLFVDGVQQSVGDSSASGLSIPAKGTGTIGGPTIGTATSLAYKGTIGEFALLPQVLTPTEIATLYDAGAAPWDGDDSGTRIGSLLDTVSWPASLRDIDTGSSTLGPATLGGSCLEALQLIERTEAGLLYMSGDGKVTFVSRTNLRAEARFITSNGTFGDSTGEIPYIDIVTSGWDDTSIINGARVGRAGGTLQTYVDATSQSAYGEAFAPDEADLLVASDGEALDRAAWKVLRFKDPAFRVDSITIMPMGPTPSTAWPQVLGRKLGDRVTVKRRPLNVGSAISVDCHIESITHTFAPRHWETTWGLSAVDPNEALYLIVGSGAAKNQVGAKAGY